MSQETYRKEYHIAVQDCCSTWNWGFRCNRTCNKWHVCSHEFCRTSFDVNHRAVQHVPIAPCHTHAGRLAGINALHPKPLTFPANSSVEDTAEACARYGVKPPFLNADLYEALLEKTSINKELQSSLVRGWREGFDLGSELPPTNHFVSGLGMVTDEQELAISRELQKEKTLGRMIGPLTQPHIDGRWFNNYWVLPHFGIPKKTPSGEDQR